ncbi:MAG: pirin family protein [Bacteroidia bacterium]|nr:pirin family protein [Bacteroidia bacterium]
MERKDFLKKSMLGLAAAGVGSVVNTTLLASENKKHIPLVGFNHLPAQTNIKMANSIIHKAESRGHADHGWLDTHHTFSFASYYNPERMHFGVLRVLNDDIVESGMGFGTHPHDNMEIISIPLSGDLEHKDSMNNVAVIKQGDIQIMSAGTGIYHSEYNRNKDRSVNFLQIWVFPKERNITPRYDQKTFSLENRINKFQQIVSPAGEAEGIDINQDAWFNLIHLKNNFATNYTIKRKGNGVYAFVIEGSVTIDNQILNKRDGMGIWETDQISIQSAGDAELLLMDVPMQ